MIPKKVLIAMGVAAVVAVGGSLIHPFVPTVNSGTNEAIFGGAQIDPDTLGIVQRACQNCHSQNTEWPWYSHVAPVSWLLARDVQQARSHMNLSRWQHYSTDERLQLLSAMGSAARSREMPPRRYLLVHPEARLSEREQQQIYRWTRSERRRIGNTQSLINPEIILVNRHSMIAKMANYSEPCESEASWCAPESNSRASRGSWWFPCVRSLPITSDGTRNI
jgi:hypothetical protein